MEWKKEIAAAKDNMADYGTKQEASAQGFGALHEAALAPGALDKKQKELIALAIGIAKQCSYCIGFHVEACIAAGASRQEIEETVNVSVLMGGGPAMMYGMKTLECYDILAKG
ncbi:carboxymuconolactone decarboxylase family protein [Thioclava atlantica]|uniref:Alkylhydroperoxidase n=1 Tax=Thioclava atlantica TaxID=1317124 RepID=A0A085U030_9RHOB|nr:carboxymuconolactone decarboxylase family protein [Thioclava atlantica]KFE36327.1 alkylhydroperoxidase [Thioclava atlantica]